MTPDSIFLVGGAVRDWLLGRTVHEYDFAFASSELVFIQRNPTAYKIGKSATIYLLNGREYSPLRANTALSLKNRLAEDLECRDLTIDALAVEENGILHAHPLAIQDLREGILRPASSHSFLDDPARIFRMVRLACQMPEFRLHPEALHAMQNIAPLSCALPAERVGKEFLKALASPRPSRWLSLLNEGNALVPWFAEWEGSANIPAGPLPYHNESVLEHSCAIMDAVAGDPLRVWMALCHDLGKTNSDPALLPHHYDHEIRGAELAVQLGTRLALPTRYIHAGSLSALLHSKGGWYLHLRIGKRCDLLMAVHTAGLDDPFWQVADADSHSCVSEQAKADLATILAVSLPPEWCNKGEKSGIHLRELRCQALVEQSEKLQLAKNDCIR